MTQHQLAEKALNALESIDERDIHAWVRGSLANGSSDEFSDIDVGISFPSLDSLAASRLVEDIMRRTFTPEITDWAPSLLPETPVVSFFLSGTPIFWVAWSSGSTRSIRWRTMPS